MKSGSGATLSRRKENPMPGKIDRLQATCRPAEKHNRSTCMGMGKNGTGRFERSAVGGYFNDPRDWVTDSLGSMDEGVPPASR